MTATSERAKEIRALVEFQTFRLVAIKFAEDLVFLGYYSLDELKDKDGAELTGQFGLKKGCRTDPCVEDQFRLVVHFADTQDRSKAWWDFTDERKRFRSENGYPETAHQKSWFEIWVLKMGFEQHAFCGQPGAKTKA